MALREELERSGAWLFRWRSYVPLVLLVPTVLALRGFTYPNGSHRLDVVWELLCLSVAGVGLAIRAATVGCTPGGTSGRNTADGQIADVLNTTGLYSLVRHPLYLGNYLLWLGPALLPRVWWLPVFVSLAFALYYERIMYAEEAFLRRKFGADFERWANATPAFWPLAAGWRARWREAALPFSARNVLRREYSGLFGVVVTFTVLELLAERTATGTWRLEAWWIALLAASALLYLTLRWCKRHTQLLCVDGR